MRDFSGKRADGDFTIISFSFFGRLRMNQKFENLLVERDGSVVVLKINRPRNLNALNTKTLKEIECFLFELAADKTATALVITGGGEKSFVAGADIAEMKEMGPIEADSFATLGQRIYFMLEESKIPVIGAVNGFALGGGCELALACDMVFCSDTAAFGQPEVKLGIIPGFGGTQRLSRKVGTGKAKELILSGEIIKADEALRIGLADRIYPAGKLLEETVKFGKAISSRGRYAVELAKKAVDAGYNMDLYKGCKLEKALFAQCFTHPDQKEGMNAFIEKREPKWKG
jgi:enoyl-CoA hydratase